MDKVGDIGSLYHITCNERMDSIMESGLMGGNDKITQRTKADEDGFDRRKDTFGKIFFTESNDERLWNGMVCDMMTPKGMWEDMSSSMKRSGSLNEGVEKSFLKAVKIKVERQRKLNWVVLELPKSYLKVMGMEIHQDDFWDMTNMKETSKYIYANKIPIEFLNIVHIFKEDYKDWHSDYKWNYVPYMMNKVMNETDGGSFMRDLIYDLIDGEFDWDGDALSLPDKYLHYGDSDGRIYKWENRDDLSEFQHIDSVKYNMGMIADVIKSQGLMMWKKEYSDFVEKYSMEGVDGSLKVLKSF